MVTAFTNKDLKEVLLDPKSGLLKQPYFTINSEATEENITLLNSGRNGLEFNKTVGFIYKYPGVLIYRCIYGRGLILVQKNDELGEAKEIKVSSIRPGVEVEVPSGYANAIINTGRTFLAVIDNSPKEDKYKDFETIRVKHGLVYYVVDKKSDIAFEKNPNYLFHPQIMS